MSDQGKKDKGIQDEELNPKPAPNISRKNNNRGNNNAKGETSCQTRISGEIAVHESQTELALIEKIRKEKKEVTKQKNFIKLPTEPELLNSRCVQENVGDDLSKKEEVHILCECEPNVSGAAVPTVISFIDNPEETQDGTSTLHTTNNDFMVISRNRETLEKTTSTLNSKKDPNQPATSSKDQMNKDTIKDVQQGSTRKPSLIPKLNKGVTTNKTKNPCSYCSRRCRGSSRNRTKNIESPQAQTLNSEKSEQSSSSSLDKAKNSKLIPPKGYKNPSTLTSNNISSRMALLQEKLKDSTSTLRQEIETDKGLDQTSLDGNSVNDFEGTIPEDKKTIDDLYENISQLKNIVSALSESNTFNSQRKCIERLFKNISEIKQAAKILSDSNNDSPEIQLFQTVEPELTNPDVNNNDEVISVENEKRKKHHVNVKDNKIRIKFLNHDGKRRSNDGEFGRSEEVQTVLSLSPKLTSESLNSITCLMSKIKDSDSMDGVFIPTYEPPANMEDEEETYGLDITITFPEIENLMSNETHSHLPVCVSDISAEALKKLKRCPKDFKLLMDFVEGKVSFQSGAGPANNFSIGPDLKFVANVDYKKSDVINIKPSTECLYSSQMIPVECAAKPKISVKSLKSTDSELLLNVVNFPFLYGNPYRDYTGGHNSCVTFRNEKLLSVAMLARQVFKSMPQIPSLTNIFETNVVENFSKTDSGTKKKKSTEPEEKD